MTLCINVINENKKRKKNAIYSITLKMKINDRIINFVWINVCWMISFDWYIFVLRFLWNLLYRKKRKTSINTVHYVNNVCVCVCVCIGLLYYSLTINQKKRKTFFFFFWCMGCTYKHLNWFFWNFIKEENRL